MLRRSAARLSALARRPRRTFLHYLPTEGRTREPVRDPQPLGNWFQYRVFDDFIPDRQGEAAYVEPPDPYVMAQMFEYDNWHFEEPHEYLATGSLLLKPLFFCFPLLVFLMIAGVQAHYAAEGGYGTLNSTLYEGNTALIDI